VLVTLFHFNVHALTFPEPLMVHGLVSTALGLWLVRKLWGSMLNTCRNLARTTPVHLGDRPEVLHRLLLLTQSFPSASMFQLRGLHWNPDLLHPDDGRPAPAPS
jgi:hypothetical protein